MADTYIAPVLGWTCFHCGETFTTIGAARDHFGSSEHDEPGCMIRVQLGEERGLLMALRRAEDQLARYRNEDSDADRAMGAMVAKHATELRAAEEAGYAKGLRDAKAEASAREKARDAVIDEAIAYQHLWDLRREVLAKSLFEKAMTGHAQWENMAEPHKDDWRKKADSWISTDTNDEGVEVAGQRIRLFASIEALAEIDREAGR